MNIHYTDTCISTFTWQFNLHTIQKQTTVHCVSSIIVVTYLFVQPLSQLDYEAKLDSPGGLQMKSPLEQVELKNKSYLSLHNCGPKEESPPNYSADNGYARNSTIRSVPWPTTAPFSCTISIYWAELSLSFRRISMFMNIIACTGVILVCFRQQIKGVPYPNPHQI